MCRPNRLLCWVVSTSDQDCVSYQPILRHPHTLIRIILFHDEQRDIPNLEFSPNHASKGFSQIAFPTTVLPKDDHVTFVQDERLGLQYWTMISAVCVVIRRFQMSGHSDFRICSTICQHLPFLLGFYLILRLLLVPRTLAIWTWCPWLLLLSFVMLMNLVLLKLHKILNRLLQYHRGVQLGPLYFWCFASNSAFFRWQMSINDAKWTVPPDVLASSITFLNLLVTFVKFHVEIFSNFSHSLSTAAFAAGIFTAWGTGIYLWTKL